jgi:hypothetical protein
MRWGGRILAGLRMQPGFMRADSFNLAGIAAPALNAKPAIDFEETRFFRPETVGIVVCYTLTSSTCLMEDTAHADGLHLHP